ncbi:hypothetical protein [Gordonia amicalis]|uniref:Uncharacterized protein n=1 Tax=Gordonia amicalis TaxID=89053 RepID=A0ABU4DJW2_9ACTN|nr:hypothetical protein [Gordonia amicalis]MDV6310040.1 hypothetical protein [Gordonia amicalis]
MTEPGTRSNGIWTWEADYLPMWQALWGGRSSKAVTDEELADILGRSVSAVRKRARELTAAGSCFAGGGLPGMRKTKRLSCEQFRAAVHTYCHSEGIPLWDNRADEKLRAAWTVGWPTLAQLGSLVGATEQQVVNRLITLGIAAGVADAADHLGATPGGPVEINARLGRAHTDTAVWVLVVTGPNGDITVTAHTDERTLMRHAQTATRALGPLARWHISENVTGEPHARTHRTGTGVVSAPRLDIG